MPERSPEEARGSAEGEAVQDAAQLLLPPDEYAPDAVGPYPAYHVVVRGHDLIDEMPLKGLLAEPELAGRDLVNVDCRTVFLDELLEVPVNVCDRLLRLLPGLRI